MLKPIKGFFSYFNYTAEELKVRGLRLIDWSILFPSYCHLEGGRKKKNNEEKEEREREENKYEIHMHSLTAIELYKMLKRLFPLARIKLSNKATVMYWNTLWTCNQPNSSCFFLSNLGFSSFLLWKKSRVYLSKIYLIHLTIFGIWFQFWISVSLCPFLCV